MEGIITRKGGGGVDTSTATATSSDIRSGKTAYVNGSKIYGNLNRSQNEYLGEATDTTSLLDITTSPPTYTGLLVQKTLGENSVERIVGPGTKVEIEVKYSDLGTATAQNVESGYTFTSVAGKEKNGALMASNSLEVSKTSVADSQSYSNSYSFAGSNNGKKILKDGASVKVAVPKTEFGDATASDVLSGKTFTSSSGIRVTGTATTSSGTDTSDATATPADIVSGKTAYVNGSKITGEYNKPEPLETVSNYSYAESGDLANVEPPVYIGSELINYDGEEKNFLLMAGVADDNAANKQLVKTNVEGIEYGPIMGMIAEMSPETFGNATAADVLAGKTFTSSEGLKLRGTNSGGGGEPAQLVSNVAPPTTPDEEIDVLNFILVEEGNASYRGASGKCLTVSTEIDDFYLNKKTSKFDIGNGNYANTAATLYVPLRSKQFGNATAADVASGKTFTSAEGLKVVGAATIGSGGIDTSDATATAEDISNGKTAYVNGEKIIGTARPSESMFETTTVDEVGFDYLFLKPPSQIALEGLKQIFYRDTATFGQLMASSVGLREYNNLDVILDQDGLSLIGFDLYFNKIAGHDTTAAFVGYFTDGQAVYVSSFADQAVYVDGKSLWFENNFFTVGFIQDFAFRFQASFEISRENPYLKILFETHTLR